MLGPRIKETTTTATAGNLTLAGAVTDFITFNTYFGTSRRFYYWVVDTTNNVWECGVGYLSASTTLVRETVLATSTTPAGTSTALTLSAGTKDVFCAPPHTQVKNSSNAFHTSAAYNGFMSAHFNEGSSRTNGHSATRYLFSPFKVEFGGLVTNLIQNITTASATGVARTGIYDISENGAPGILLAETAEYSTTATGLAVRALGSAIYLPDGWYYIVTNCDENFTIAATDYTNVDCSPLGMHTEHSAKMYGYTNNESYPSGGMPADWEARSSPQSITLQHGQHPPQWVMERS
jgi:hypothetical protein